MAFATTPLLDALQRLPPGHLCSVYSSQDEQFASAIPFIRLGLERRERCLYVADDEPGLEPVRAAMTHAGIEVDDAIRSGALVLTTQERAYLRVGQFDPTTTLAFWREQMTDALRSGYSGLRATAETGWVVHGGSVVDQWMEYESLLTNTVAEIGCLALCQYDRRVCSPSFVLNAIRTHPAVIYGDRVCENFYFVPPEQFLTPDCTGYEVERRLRNVHEREQTLHELKLFRALIDRSNDAIEVVDPETLGFLDVNEKACLDLGYSRQELLSRSVFDIDPVVDLASVAQANQEWRQAGSLIFESRHRRKDGSTFPVEVNLKYIQLERNYLVIVTRDITERKRMEDALREREDRYRDLVEHSCDLICTHDLDGRLLSINELPEKVLGYSRNEILNTPMRDLIPAADRRKFDDYLIRIRRDGVATGLVVVLTRSGERRIWEYHNTLRTEGVSQPIVRGIAHDITEQKRFEKALRSSEEKFSKAFRSSPVDMAIITRAEGLIIDVNESFERQTGFARDEAVGHSCAELGLCVDAGERAAILLEIETNGRVRNREIELRTRSGEVRMTLYSAEPIEIGGKPCLLVVCEDITQRKVAEKRLRLSEEKFAKAFRASPEVISIASLREGRFIEVNEAFERQSGFRREEVIGRTDLELGIWPDAQQRDTLRERIGKEGGLRDREVQFRTRSGQLRTILVATEVIELEGERCVLAVGQDITALKEAEQELRRLSRCLTCSQEEERRRIARELHDSTAQDLTGLRMGLGIIKRSAQKLDRKALRTLTECQELAERCAREIRTFSYLLHPPLLDEFGLVFALRGYLHGFGTRSGLRVRLEADPGLEQGRLSPELETNLFRIVQEGLTNIKHHSGSQSAAISLKQRDGEVTLEIRDKGHGIEAAVAKAIENGNVAALGVGLSGMRERVRQLGGTFKVETSESGTSLCVVLPLNRS
jgi:PAS domain S-box-containing protein